MVAKKPSLFQRFMGILKSKKFSADQKRVELRRLVSQLKDQEGTLEYRVKKLEKEREWLIQQGTQAAHESDSRRRRRAAQRLDLNRLKLAQFYQRLDNLAKALFMCEAVQVELASQLPDGIGSLLQRVTSALEDDKLAAWLEDSTISFEMVQERIETRLASVRTGITGGAEMLETPTETERALIEMAEREKHGDTDGARRVRETLAIQSAEQFDSEPLPELVD